METELFRILCLDFGDKRIGLALSDLLGITAQGLSTLERRSSKQDLAYLKSVIEEQEVGRVVVGLPLNMDGSVGQRAQLTLDFVEWLKKHLSVPVITWDERLSSYSAEQVLQEAGLNWQKRRKVVDKVAAVMILQSYLARKKPDNAI